MDLGTSKFDDAEICLGVKQSPKFSQNGPNLYLDSLKTVKNQNLKISSQLLASMAL